MAALTHGLSSNPHHSTHSQPSCPRSLLQQRRSLSFPAARTSKQASLIQRYGLYFEQKDDEIGRFFLVVSCLSSRNCRTAVKEGSDLHVNLQSSRSRVIAQALPSAGSAAVAIFMIGAAVVALSRLKEDGTQGLQLEKKECEICKGSGVCSSCSGEGFLLKNLSPEAAAKARASAKDAATRYTAGLPNKWRYCTACSGSRNCLACEGRGWLD